MIFEARRYSPGLTGIGVNIGWGRFKGVSIALLLWIITIGSRAPAEPPMKVVCKNCPHEPVFHTARREPGPNGTALTRWVCAGCAGSPGRCLEFEPVLVKA